MNSFKLWTEGRGLLESGLNRRGGQIKLLWKFSLRGNPGTGAPFLPSICVAMKSISAVEI